MMILAVMMVITISANAMSYNAAKHEALFLSDKMAYELNLTAAQYEAVYEINLDYLMSLNGHGDVFGIWWDRRNADLRFVLTPWQYDKGARVMNDKGHMGNHNMGNHNMGNHNAHKAPNREIAMNTRTNRSGSGHFGGRR